MNDLEGILRYCIDNTSETSKLSFLSDSLEHEDYIIFFYSNVMSTRGVNLSRYGLAMMMASHKDAWLDSNSIYTKKYNSPVGDLAMKRVPTEYIQSRSKKDLARSEDYSNELYHIVMNRFDSLSNIENYNEDDVVSSLESYKVSSQDKYAHLLIESILPMLTGESNELVIDRKRYNRMELLPFIRDLTASYIDKICSSSVTKTADDINSKLLAGISGESGSGPPIFHWNISRSGMNILNNMQTGWVVTLNAPPKVGKTKFAIGELVYPAVCEGSNVKYYSGEMSKSEIIASLCVKHVYATQGLKLDFKMACDVIQISVKTRLKSFKNKQEFDDAKELINSYNRTRVELVLAAFNELIYSGNFGSINVVHAGDDLTSEDSLQFVCEDYITTNMNEIKKLDDSSRPDLVIIDHINHFTSRSNKSLNEKLESIYQGSKKLANNNLHPVGVLVINHTNTKETRELKKVTSAEDLKDMTFDSYGSASDRKDADIALSLVMTPEQEREGTVTLVINDDRRQSHQQTFGTNQFVLIADKSVNDFCLVGTQKSVYRTSKRKIVNVD